MKKSIIITLSLLLVLGITTLAGADQWWQINSDMDVFVTTTRLEADHYSFKVDLTYNEKNPPGAVDQSPIKNFYLWSNAQLNSLMVLDATTIGTNEFLKDGWRFFYGTGFLSSPPPGYFPQYLAVGPQPGQPGPSIEWGDSWGFSFTGEATFEGDPKWAYAYNTSAKAFLLDRGKIYALDSAAVPAVPEPATMLLVGVGLTGLAGLRRRFNG